LSLAVVPHANSPVKHSLVVIIIVVAATTTNSGTTITTKHDIIGGGGARDGNSINKNVGWRGGY